MGYGATDMTTSAFSGMGTEKTSFAHPTAFSKAGLRAPEATL